MLIILSNAASSFVQNTLQGRNFDVLLYELVIGADPDGLLAFVSGDYHRTQPIKLYESGLLTPI